MDDAVANTLKNKLLDVDYEGTTGILLHIRGGEDLTLGEANEMGRKADRDRLHRTRTSYGAQGWTRHTTAG